MIYIVDYENVGVNGLVGQNTLSFEDEVIVFLNPSHKKIETSYIINSKASFRFIGIIPNKHKNYMDFQIVALCSKLLNDGRKVAIISNDGGYSAVQDFFRDCVYIEKKTDVKLYSNLQGDPVEIPKIKKVTTKTSKKTKKTSEVKKSDSKLTINSIDINKEVTVAEVEAEDSSSNDTILDDFNSNELKPSLVETLKNLPLTDVQRDSLHKAINLQNTKKGKVSEKKFIKKLNFLPSSLRDMVIPVILPYVLA